MTSIQFGSKAQTLKDLSEKLRSAKVLPVFFFTTEEWADDKKLCIANAYSYLGSGPWIVRSSCSKEDGSSTSNAGAFLSVLNVDAENLISSVDQVIASYGNLNFSDQVLIQPMLKNVLYSGVAFSHDPNTCSPYRVVNWHEGGDTTAVTSGELSGRIWQQAAKCAIATESKLAPVMAMIEEVLLLIGGTPVDIEFAITLHENIETLWLLQARPLILREVAESEWDQAKRLNIIHNKIEKLMAPNPFLAGKKTVYGVMPDWNPAEIIGIRPKPLSLSIYRELVTDSIWAYQRNNYGYRNLRSFPLIQHFMGLPYVDVRVSFNSFIPADIDDGLAGRLVDHYINHLISQPSLHDKVEFEIVFSCYTFDLLDRLKALTSSGISNQEQSLIANSLRVLTNQIIGSKKSLWHQDASKLVTLEKRRLMIFSEIADPFQRVYWLLEDAKRYGTLPFAGLARVAFIAVQILRSLVALGVFTNEDYDSFISSVDTVSGKLARDRSALDKSDFLAFYGHLRPGTYDITSPRYDEAPDLYFDWSRKTNWCERNKQYLPSERQLKEVDRLLGEHFIELDALGLFEFIREAIVLREEAKFRFSRNLSDALALITTLGAQYDFTREDLAYCDINVFKEIFVSAINAKELITNSIEVGKLRYVETLKTSLPPLITKPEEVFAFASLDTSPNYITQKKVTATVVSSKNLNNVSGSIVCIPNADPGFDWLFAYPIAGLVTAWGGTNSHMAIRAGELGLPAVIGAGEALYTRWSQAKIIHLDCAGQRVDVLE